MPTAPTYGPQRANIAAVPGVRQDANRTPQEYGADFGGVVQAAGKLGEEVYVNQSITRAQQEANGFNAELDSDLNAYAQLRGDQARGLGVKATESLQKRLEARRQALQGNPIALKAFDRQAHALAKAFTNAVNRHEASQVYAADQATLSTALDRDIETAAKLAGSEGFQAGLDNVERSSIARSTHQGVDPETAAQQAKLLVPKVKSRSVDMALAEGDVVEARRRFDLLESGMLAEDRSRLKGELDRRAAFTDANAAVNAAFSAALDKLMSDKKNPRTAWELTEAEVQTELNAMKLSPQAAPMARAALNEKFQQYTAATKQQMQKAERSIVDAMDAKRSAEGITDISYEFADEVSKSDSLRAWWKTIDDERRVSIYKHMKDGPVLRSKPAVLRDLMFKIDNDPTFKPSPIGVSRGDFLMLEDYWNKRQKKDNNALDSRVSDAEKALANIIPDSGDRAKAEELRLALIHFATNNPEVPIVDLIEKGAAWKSTKVPAIRVSQRDIAGAITKATAAKSADDKREFADAVLDWTDSYRGLANNADNRLVDAIAPTIISGASKSWAEYKKLAGTANPMARDAKAFALAIEEIREKQRKDIIEVLKGSSEQKSVDTANKLFSDYYTRR